MDISVGSSPDVSGHKDVLKHPVIAGAVALDFPGDRRIEMAREVYGPVSGRLGEHTIVTEE